jgi:hypothetical protein
MCERDERVDRQGVVHVDQERESLVLWGYNRKVTPVILHGVAFPDLTRGIIPRRPLV